MNEQQGPGVDINKLKPAEVKQSVDEKIKPEALVESTNEKFKPYTAFLSKFNHDWSQTLARALAYSLLTTMFPITLVILSTLGIAIGTLDSHAQAALITRMQSALPSVISSGDLIQTALTQLAKISGILGVISVILAIFTGSRLFLLIEQCFNIIYRTHSRPALRQNIVAIAMLLLFVILIPVMIAASSAPAIITSLIKNTPAGHTPFSGLLFNVLGFLGSLLAAWILFQAIYMVVPNQRISFARSWRGAGVSAVALQIFLSLFPVYATHFLGGFIGQVGFAIILLAFFYYFGLILLLGAEVNAFFFERVDKTDDLADLVYLAAHQAGGDRRAS
jgi:membrane protein